MWEKVGRESRKEERWDAGYNEMVSMYKEMA
jgi:hypothetical protein